MKTPSSNEKLKKAKIKTDAYFREIEGLKNEE